jgi:GTP cyclohydrolase I
MDLDVKSILKSVVPTPVVKNAYTNQQKIEMISKHFSEILQIIGLDLKDDSLRDTPLRIAKMYVNEIFSGLDIENFPKITVINNKMKYDQMVLVQKIKVLSFCEHHFQTIDGFATVAYIPENKVIGLSKINRIVNFFARRPQVQERLTKQVADCLQAVLKSDNVAVHLTAKHYCVIARGVEHGQSITTTSDLRGAFKKQSETRDEFLRHCQPEV